MSHKSPKLFDNETIIAQDLSPKLLDEINPTLNIKLTGGNSTKVSFNNLNNNNTDQTLQKDNTPRKITTNEEG